MGNYRFLFFQKLGRSLMLPIAVLPIAGLLLRLGQADLLGIDFLSEAGKAIFTQLPLLFAIGVAVGFAKDNNGVAGLSGAVGYFVMTEAMKSVDPTINMGVLSGIITGLFAGYFYNRFYTIQFPEYLAFFAGKRFVPIITGVTCLVLAMVFGILWPPVQMGIDALSKTVVDSGSIGLFFYGVLNRILIITGLHHILNNFAWFIVGDFTTTTGEVVTGDLKRFFAGDPDAGAFMSGFFPIMMFGLPAACLAMYRAALPENRIKVGGILLSMALTSFLTGITEPVEFAFMFLAPLLFLLHSVLTGISLALMHALDVKLGFTFSAGALDYILSYGISTNGWVLIPVGLVYFVLYYFLFSYTIKRFNLMTLGRSTSLGLQHDFWGESSNESGSDLSQSESSRAKAFINALGGSGNMESIDACATRLRLVVANDDKVNDEYLLKLGARGVIRPSKGQLQVVLGPIADNIAEEIRQEMFQQKHK